MLRNLFFNRRLAVPKAFQLVRLSAGSKTPALTSTPMMALHSSPVARCELRKDAPSDNTPPCVLEANETPFNSAESTPAESVPLESPVESTPAESVPLKSPVESTPAESVPLESPVESAPVVEVTAGEEFVSVDVEAAPATEDPTVEFIPAFTPTPTPEPPVAAKKKIVRRVAKPTSRAIIKKPIVVKPKKVIKAKKALVAKPKKVIKAKKALVTKPKKVIKAKKALVAKPKKAIVKKVIKAKPKKAVVVKRNVTRSSRALKKKNPSKK
ncbi:copper-resistance protein CopB [Perkinsela sp. CCAP 1560/4]|nr:copper-resistance protein CopB [Perkinsela sp. CCAP 1560/4]|eukprot:KNH05409.1 copper-resistance protein CopB [Perkinsela sp. CCAP 1560/4]